MSDSPYSPTPNATDSGMSWSIRPNGDLISSVMEGDVEIITIEHPDGTVEVHRNDG